MLCVEEIHKDPPTYAEPSIWERLCGGGWIVILSQAAGDYRRARPLSAAETAKVVARMRAAANPGPSTGPESQPTDPFCWLGHPLRPKELSFVKHMCAICKSPQHHWPGQPTFGWFCGECSKLRLPAWRCWSCVKRDPRPAAIRSEEQIRLTAGSISGSTLPKAGLKILSHYVHLPTKLCRACLLRLYRRRRWRRRQVARGKGTAKTPQLCRLRPGDWRDNHDLRLALR